MEASSAGKFLKLDKQRNDKTVCDVTLSIEDEKFYCHRNVLAASSQYFATMFQGDFVERTKDDIQLKNVNKTLFSAFLDLAYTGKTTLFTMDNITDMLIMASMLMSELLEKAAVDFMKHSICMSNIINYIELSINHGLTFLSEWCVDYLCGNFTRILLDDANIFLQLPFQIFHEVLDEVEVDEETYVKSILSWLKFDTERFKYAEQLIKTIDFVHIDASSLLNEVLDNTEMLFQIVNKYFSKFSITSKNRLLVAQIDIDEYEPSMPFWQLNFFSLTRRLRMTNNFVGFSKIRSSSNIQVAILRDSVFFWTGDDHKCNFSDWNLKSNFFRRNRVGDHPKSLQSMIGINEKNKIYASHQIGNLPPSLHCYDPVRNNWLDIEVQNNNIYEQCLVGSNDGNGIYLCGGLIQGGPGRNVVKSDIISLYDDRDKNQFQNVGKLVQGSHNCVATIMNNSIYVLDGGVKSTDTRLPKNQKNSELIVQRFDMNAGKSQLVSSIEYNRPFALVSAATFKGKIWISGSFGRCDQVLCYDEKRNIWKRKNWNLPDLKNIFLFTPQ